METNSGKNLENNGSQRNDFVIGGKGMENRLVSILIPCYNHEKYVADCLKSILKQTYSNLEVIICDDYSQDASVEEIKKYAEIFQESNIHFVLMKNEKNCGVTFTINRMLKIANGEYVKIIASDDMLMENYILEMVAEIEKDDSLKFVFSNGILVREDTKYPVKKEDEIKVRFKYVPDCKRNMMKRIFLNNFIFAPGIFFRKSILDEVGGYDENIGIEDLEMSLRILCKYPKGLGGYGKPLVYYRINENSMSSRVRNAGYNKRISFMYKNNVAILRKYRKYVSATVYWKAMLKLSFKYMVRRLFRIF